MIGFAQVHEALNQGKRVRLDRWDAGTVLFVENNEIVQLVRGEHRQPFQFTWREINRKDWRIL